MPSRYSTHSGSNTTPTPTSGSQVEVGVVDLHPGSGGGGSVGSGSRGGSVEVGGVEGEANGELRGTSGSPVVDRALIQHLIHCESLLVVSTGRWFYSAMKFQLVPTPLPPFLSMQHLHSSGPLKYRLSASLKKLQQEAEIISELLNIAADPSDPPQVHQSKHTVGHYLYV